jgi:hypothetical protein
MQSVSKNSGQNGTAGVFSQSIGKSGLGQYVSYRLWEILRMSDKSKIEWTDATWKPIWSARTCPRFGTTRPVLRNRTAEGGRVASRKAASSRRSPNMKAAFFFKQWGGVRKSETGRELDRRTYDEFPERRQNPVPDLEFRRNALEQLEATMI